jgi:hypothetical protein
VCVAGDREVSDGGERAGLLMLRNIRFGAVQAEAGHGADLHGEQQQMSHVPRGIRRNGDMPYDARWPNAVQPQSKHTGEMTQTSATWGLVMIQWAPGSAYLLAS